MVMKASAVWVWLRGRALSAITGLINSAPGAGPVMHNLPQKKDAYVMYQGCLFFAIDDNAKKSMMHNRLIALPKGIRGIRLERLSETWR